MEFEWRCWAHDGEVETVMRHEDPSTGEFPFTVSTDSDPHSRVAERGAVPVKEMRKSKTKSCLHLGNGEEVADGGDDAVKKLERRVPLDRVGFDQWPRPR